jgi:hypothetical protein
MQYYLVILGVALIAGSLYLLVDRLQFLRNATKVVGKVSRVRRMDYAVEDDGGPSMHVEVVYVDNRGDNRTHIVDNSLLTFVYRVGQPIDLAISEKKVLVNSLLNIVTAPAALFLVGAITLSLYLPMT